MIPLRRVVVTLDRHVGSFTGRPCGIHDEEYVSSLSASFLLLKLYSIDQDLPVECDDKFWDCPDPDLNFKQPAGKPSIMSFFNSYLGLMDILSYTMRSVVSISCWILFHHCLPTFLAPFFFLYSTPLNSREIC